MWFKNLRLYRLLEPFGLTEDELDGLLREREFRHCGVFELSARGWTSPVGRDRERLVHEAGGCLMVCLRQEDKLLPAAVVSEALEDKCAAIEAEEGRKVARRERTELRDEITQQLLPKAFAKSSRTCAVIDRQQGWILVDAASSGRAEALIGLLRETLGSLPVRPFETVLAPAAVLTEWVRRPHQQDDFVLLDSCELQDTGEEGGVVRCKGQDLGSDEIHAHLTAGKQVTRLAMEWQARLAFTLESDLALKRIKFLDIIQEEASATETEDEVAQFDLVFTLMTLEFRRLLPRLLGLFGGMLPDE